MALSERQQAIYDTIKLAAIAGRVCPTNREIAKVSGLASTSSVADAIGRLQRQGKLMVTRYNRSRIVVFPDLDLATAEPPASTGMGQAPHWRSRLPGVSYLPDPPPPMFPPPAPWRLQWRPQRWQPKTCQFIEGAPSRDDSVKCGKAVAPSSPYCDSHRARCYLRPQTA